MKFLLKTLTIISLINIANSSDLQNTNSILQNQNNNSQIITSQIVDQSNTLQNQYLQKKKHSDDMQSESQEHDSEILSSDNDNSICSFVKENISTSISQDIINNPKMLNKYPILKLVQNDDINVQNITIKKLSEKTIQCLRSIDTVSSIILDQDKNDNGNISKENKDLLETLLCVLDKLTYSFSTWYGYLTDDDEDLHNVIESINLSIFSITYSTEICENEIDRILMIATYFDTLYNDLEKIPAQYLNKTVKKILSEAEQKFNDHFKKKKND